MPPQVSISIETTARVGGLALGIDGRLVDADQFDSAGRHAAVLIERLDKIIKKNNLTAQDISRVYVSVGPGSFTGVRIAATAARTLAQAIPKIKIVSVPTAMVIAENARHLGWDKLAVVLASKGQSVYFAPFKRNTEDSKIIPDGEPIVGLLGEILSNRVAGIVEDDDKITLVGEGLNYFRNIDEPDERHCRRDACDTNSTNGYRRDACGTESFLKPILTFAKIAPAELDCPKPQNVWHIGNTLAQEGKFTPPNQLLPIYPRQPEAVRLWKLKNRTTTQPAIKNL